MENGRLDYVERSILSTGTVERVDVSFPVKRDDKMFGELLGRAGTLYRCLVRGEAPQRETCWLCRHCLHRDACE